MLASFLDVGGHLGKGERGVERAEQAVHLGVLEGLAFGVEVRGGAEEHDGEGGGRGLGHRSCVGFEHLHALLDHRAMIRMQLGQFLQVRRGPLLLLVGDLGDGQTADEAPDLGFRLGREVGECFLGGERRFEVSQERVEALVVERLTLGVVFGDGGIPLSLERDRDAVERRSHFVIRSG